MEMELAEELTSSLRMPISWKAIRQTNPRAFPAAKASPNHFRRSANVNWRPFGNRHTPYSTRMSRSAAALPYKLSPQNQESRSCGLGSLSLAEAPTRATRFPASGAGRPLSRSHGSSPTPEAHWHQRWAGAFQKRNIRPQQLYRDRRGGSTIILPWNAEPAR
jgi:hypothetical protein